MNSSRVISKVQDDVPISPARTKSGRSKYPFKSMKLNSSFEVKQPQVDLDNPKALNRLAQTVRAAGRRYGRFTGKRFEVRSGNQCVRCWRVE